MTDDDLIKIAEEAEREAEVVFVRRRRDVEDFRYDEVQAKYWDCTTGTLLCGASVDGAVPKEWWPTVMDAKGKPKMIPPSKAINDVDTGLTVEGSTWWPGKPRFIRDYVVNARGVVPQKGAATYNAYCAPERTPPPPGFTADKWIDHVKLLFPEPLEHEHFFDFAAHMLQRADEKVNHGIVIAGEQGIGKDTALLPLRNGVGVWNSAEVDPDAISRQYNHYVQSVMLVINEVRPHDEDHKASNFYNQLKPLLASPPEMLPMEMKYANVIYVRNLCHTILTTNDPLTMYIPPEDRRLFVLTSPLPDPKVREVFPPGYFDEMYDYLEAGGSDAVIQWLLERDISEFNAGSPPPMTKGKKAIIESAHQVRRTALDDLLDALVHDYYEGERPRVIFAKDLHDFLNFCNLFDDLAAVKKMINARNFHFKMAERGFDMVRPEYGHEFRKGKFRSRVAFVDKELPFSEQMIEVEAALEKRPLSFEYK